MQLILGYFMSCFAALLAGSIDVTSIKSAMNTTFGDVKDAVVQLITAALPFALAIIGTVLAVTIGIKVFKKLTAQA